MQVNEPGGSHFFTLLSGLSSPFPNIYDAISEQLLLLLFKARQLNEHPEYRKWFEEQHQVLAKLRLQSNKINEIHNPSKYRFLSPESKRDSLIDALLVMRQIYQGFDEGKSSIRTWGDMCQQPLQQHVRLTEEDKLWEELIKDDLFSILTEVRAHCLPIPSQERKGYSHQDLSIAHSYSDELLSLLDDFHKIDSLEILADAIYFLVYELNNQEATLPNCLSQFGNIHIYDLGEKRRETSAFSQIVEIINEEERSEFVERLVEQCEPQSLNYLFYQYVRTYALDTMQWLTRLHMYFSYAQPVQFEWKFTTTSPDAASQVEEAEQPSVAWNSDYCQISIKRDSLLKLIQNNALHDAVDYLSDSLQQFYHQSVHEMCKQKGTIPKTSEQERSVKISNLYDYQPQNQGFAQKCIARLQLFEKWHENNKVVLISHKKKRTERISVEVRLAGLKCFDLKMGIPSGSGMKIKDGVYDLVKDSLHLKNSISNVSLQRYHSQVKKIIKEDIDVLVLNQRKHNDRYPFSGASLSIKPLWCKSKYDEKP